MTNDELFEWLTDRIADETAAIELFKKYATAKAASVGARDAYINVLKHLNSGVLRAELGVKND